jgi:flagellin
MAFSINTNLTALQSYNALAKINAKTYQSQIRLATGKRINSVADDTSGFNIGKALESKAMVNKAELNNADAALNYLSTAEASLQQVNDMLTQIQAKYVDSKDAAKDTSSIAKDIRSIASEIDSIMKNTKFNDQNLLAQSDGSALASNAVFDVSGNVTMDFAGSSYLNVETLKTVLEGGTITVPSSDPAVTDVVGTDFADTSVVVNSGADTSSTFKVILGDDTELSFTMTISSGETISQVMDYMNNNFDSSDLHFGIAGGTKLVVTTMDPLPPWADGKQIKSIQTTSGFDIVGYLGIDYGASTTITSGGLMNTDTDTVIEAASNLTSVINNVKSSLGRIGNLTQQVQIRSDFLTSSIANSESSVSRLFDADMAQEQLIATKNSIGGQAATQMLAQANTNPQQLLQLFR